MVLEKMVRKKNLIKFGNYWMNYLTELDLFLDIVSIVNMLSGQILVYFAGGVLKGFM